MVIPAIITPHVPAPVRTQIKVRESRGISREAQINFLVWTDRRGQCTALGRICLRNNEQAVLLDLRSPAAFQEVSKVVSEPVLERRFVVVIIVMDWWRCYENGSVAFHGTVFKLQARLGGKTCVTSQ